MQLKCIQPIETALDCRLFLLTLSLPVFQITVSNSSFCSSLLLGTQYDLIQIMSSLFIKPSFTRSCSDTDRTAELSV